VYDLRNDAVSFYIPGQYNFTDGTSRAQGLQHRVPSFNKVIHVSSLTVITLLRSVFSFGIGKWVYLLKAESNSICHCNRIGL
jgi:hypothetical protein